MHTKTVYVDINWLDAIDGLTVADAIKYLQTLDQNHKITCWIDGDTHGCELVAKMSYDVPMTNEEIFAQLEKHYLKEINLFESAKQKHIKDGRQERVINCESLLKQLYSKLEEAKIKYTGKQ